MKPALQLYTVRKDLELNAERTLERIKSLGIDAVEVAPLPDNLSSAGLAKLLHDFELKVAAIHCDLPLGDKVRPVADLANELSCRQIIWHGWPRDPAFDTLDGVHRLADRYNQANENAQHHGLQLGLHNHWWEYEPVEGQFPYRIFLENLSPELFLELDTYWARAAGPDPATLLGELGNRVQFLHLKDGTAKKGDAMQALGDGVMDFPSILNAASQSVEWLVIELDECETDIWEAVQGSVAYLAWLKGQNAFKSSESAALRSKSLPK